MDCPADVSDVQAVFERDLTDSELARVNALLEDGWELLLSRVPGLEFRLGTGALRLGAVVAVLRAAVAAVLRNPGGFVEESIEDWTGKRGAAATNDRIVFSADDLLPLMPYTIGGGAFEITLSAG